MSKLLPVTDFGEFEHLLPHPLEERLTAKVVTAHSALQVCSAVSVLRREDALDDQVIRVIERAQSNFSEAIAAIRGLGEDALVSEIGDWLLGIGTRIKAEWNGELEAGAFAASVVEGALGSESCETGALEGALILSLQWDADPGSAVANFESPEE